VLLRHYRLAAGLTQEELAERAGLSVKGLSSLENGKRQAPYRHSVTLLAAALRLSEDDAARLEAVVVRRRGPASTTPSVRVVQDALMTGTGHADLPISPTPLIGREHEVAEVLRLLQREDIRFLTLTGPGGVGKTRLALQIALRLQEHFADGVVFVSLAALSTPDLVLTTVAHALGVEEPGSRTLQSTLATFLRHKHLLLVIDNFEHVASAAIELVPLLAACAGLRLLVTSRARLRLQVEQVFSVPPLALPNLHHLPAVEALGQVPAVALFVRRAQAAQQDFVLTPATAEAVAAICVRLDGLPLAIELAAARVVVLPAAALLARLAQPLQVLTSGPQDLPARQQTLRATITWSYSLLSEAEQALFRRFSIFAGGATLEAVEAVCKWGDVSNDPTAGAHVLDGVSRLIHLHLLGQGATGEGYPEGEPRFSVLATMQEFGREQLGAMGELEDVRRRHASYFLTLADNAWPRILHSEAVVWLERLEEELDNLRATFGWCVARGQMGDQEPAECGMLTAGYLLQFWTLRGHVQDGADWLGRLLALPAAQVRTAGRAAALWCLGFLRAFGWGDLSAAEALCEESTTLARELGDQRSLACGLFCWGSVCAFFPRPGTNDIPQARAYLDEAAALFEELGDHDSRAFLAGTWGCQGVALIAAGELSDAETRLARGLELAKATGERWYTATALGFLGHLAAARGDLPGARALLEQSLLHHEALRYLGGSGMMLACLGDVRQRSGDLVAARAHYARALHTLHAIGHGPYSHRALCGLVDLASATGEPARALTLVSVAMALANEEGLQPGPPEQARLEQVRAASAQALSGEVQAAAWAAGLTMPLEQVIAEELAQAETAGQQAD
jgi:predicted ATPase/transcriptional regulator with XRE-family HTH domain